MIRLIPIAFAALALVQMPLQAQPQVGPVSGQQSEGPADCTVDVDAMMALSPAAFDQDLTGGWRPLADRKECQKAAADLITMYISRNWALLNQRSLHILYWHVGQMEAMAGDTRKAIAFLMAGAGPSDRSTAIGFPDYALGTIAFLNDDLAGLTAARERLAAVPRPEPLEPGGQQGWPPNLDVLDGLIRCFGSSYADAYGSRCRTPAPKN